MRIKRKGAIIIIAAVSITVFILALVFFIKTDKNNSSMNDFARESARNSLQLFINSIENNYAQSVSLIKKLEWEIGISSFGKSTGEYIKTLETKAMEIGGLTPRGLGFYIYLLKEDMVISDFAGIKRSTDFFNLYFKYVDEDAYNLRNDLIIQTPRYMINPAKKVIINGEQKEILPLYHLVREKTFSDAPLAIICVYFGPADFFAGNYYFPYAYDARIEIRDLLDSELYSFSENNMTAQDFEMIEQSSDDGLRFYSLKMPKSFFGKKYALQAIFLIIQILCFISILSGGLLGFYAYYKQRFMSIYRQYETFSKKGSAAKFLDQALIENAGIANSFVIRDYMERNYFFQRCVFSSPPGPEIFRKLCGEYDVDLSGIFFQALRIVITESGDSYRRRMRSLAVRESIEQIRGAKDILFDERPGVIGLVIATSTERDLTQKRKQITRKLKTSYRYLSIYAGRMDTDLLAALYFWFETSPGVNMKKLEDRIYAFQKKDKDLLYYYPPALEMALCNNAINGHSKAVEYLIELIRRENFSSRFKGQVNEKILFEELEQTILKIQLNSNISAGSPDNAESRDFDGYKKLFIAMCGQSLRSIDNEEDNSSS